MSVDMRPKSEVEQSYCPLCANTGIDIDNNPCTCKFNLATVLDGVSCLDVPELYQGKTFTPALLPQDLPEAYGKMLDEMLSKIRTLRWRNSNVCICSPILHGKTIFCYTCMEILFRGGMPTFPLYDVLELKRMMLDTDLGKKAVYDVEDPQRMFTVPLLFAKIPRMTNWEVYDMVAVLLDRRTRRGGSTIFVYDGTWDKLTKFDYNNILIGLMGDGSYGSLKVSNWYNQTVETLPEMQIDENLG